MVSCITKTTQNDCVDLFKPHGHAEPVDAPIILAIRPPNQRSLNSALFTA